MQSHTAPTAITPGRSTNTMRGSPGPRTSILITSLLTVLPPATLARMRTSTSLRSADSCSSLQQKIKTHLETIKKKTLHYIIIGITIIHMKTRLFHIPKLRPDVYRSVIVRCLVLKQVQHIGFCMTVLDRGSVFESLSDMTRYSVRQKINPYQGIYTRDSSELRIDEQLYA